MDPQGPYPVPVASYGRQPQIGYEINDSADPESLSNLDPDLLAGMPRQNNPQAHNLQPAFLQGNIPQPPGAYNLQTYSPQAYNPQGYNPYAYNPQAYNPQPANQYAYNQEAYIPQPADQGNNPQAYNPQAYNSQPADQYAYNQEAYTPQPANQYAYNQEAYIPQPADQGKNPQAYNSQPASQQLNSPKAPIPQAKTPQAHVRHAATQPQLLTFEEQIGYFRPVPEPHPDPTPRSGPGRKKKNQRFWAPQDASDDLKTHYEVLQTCDTRVSLAEKKLAENNNPSRTEHLQKMVLRNWAKREETWMECERMAHGLVAVELGLDAAGNRVRERYQDYRESFERVQIREQSLRIRYGLADNAGIEMGQLLKEDRQGLQTMINWRDSKCRHLRNSVATLQNAIERTYGPNPEGWVGGLTLIHELGIYTAWSTWLWTGDSPHDIAQRHKYADPDPSTWDLSDPDFFAKPLAEPHQDPQLGSGQAAEYPHANLGNGAGLDKMAVVDGQPAQYQQQPQIQQEHVSKEDPEKSVEENLAVIQAFSREQDQPQEQEAPVFKDDPEGLVTPTEEELEAQLDAELGVDDGEQDQPLVYEKFTKGMEAVPEMTYDEVMADMEANYPDLQLGQPQGQDEPQEQDEPVNEMMANMDSRAEVIDRTVADLERQGLTMTEAQTADTLGTTGPDGEFQPPQGQAGGCEVGSELYMELFCDSIGEEDVEMADDENPEDRVEWEDVPLAPAKST